MTFFPYNLGGGSSGLISNKISPEQFSQLYLAAELNKARGFLSPEIAAASVLAQDTAKNIPGQVQQSYADILPGLSAAGVNTRNIGRLGAAGATGLSAYQQFAANEPTGAITSIVGGLGGGKLASMGARALTAGMPGIGGKIIRAASPIIGSVLGTQLGPVAEDFKNKVTGQQTGNKPETKGTEPPAYIPGTNIPLNETARYLESLKAIGNQELDLYKGYSAADRAGMKDIIQHSMETQIQLSKRLDPIIQQSKDKDMVRTQALLNTQGNVDARLGMLATQGALAKGAQAEAGALARTFASTNPYIQAAVRQSPNIQFG